ncbi:hypothetical protein, partial [Promicromonospora kroppenstedtii]|uniref:hypothetical protein n=1 Tax=Promicromonospora kroppenstedtii TaxID=440482 RepID=UPI00056B253B
AEIENLLGTRVVAQLASRESPTARTLQTWLDAVERLGPAPATRTARTAPGPGTEPDTTTPEENRA